MVRHCKCLSIFVGLAYYLLPLSTSTTALAQGQSGGATMRVKPQVQHFENRPEATLDPLDPWADAPPDRDTHDRIAVPEMGSICDAVDPPCPKGCITLKDSCKPGR